MRPLHLNALTFVSALGAGSAPTRDALLNNRSGLRKNDFEHAPLDCYIGRVDGLEAIELPATLRTYDCRNHRLALAALTQDGFEQTVARARARYGADRIAVLMGTSTSGILSTELAYQRRDPQTGALPTDLRYDHTHNFGALAEFVRLYLQLRGPSLAISTACSSSAKVVASAHRLIHGGVCDAAVVGGVDSLCLTTLYGFNSLQLVSRRPCRPFDAARDGLSIGEAAGFALLEREPNDASDGIAVRGYGESSDAHHMSAPHPEGRGAQSAMTEALERAGLTTEAIDFIHAHGTATRNNDSTESLAVREIFGGDVPLASTKGALGHTLGAAGIAGVIVSYLALKEGFIPGTTNTDSIDPECRAKIQLRSERRALRNVVTNAFGFGGNNCSLVLGRLS